MKDYLDNYTIEELEELLNTYKVEELRARGVYEHNDPNFFDHNNLDDDLWYPLDAPSDEGDYKFYENEINKVENAIGFKKRQDIEDNNIHATRTLNNISNTNIDLLNYDKQVEMLYNKLNHANDEEHIGIMGEWGSGKSFLINQLREKLDKEGVPNVVIKATTTRHENTIWYTVLLSVSQYYLANNHDSSVFNEFRMLFKKYKFIFKSLFSKKSLLLLLINITIISVPFLMYYWYKKDILLILTLLPTLPAYKSLYSAAKEIFNLNSSFFEKYTYPDYKKSIGESEQVKLELNIHKELILKNTNKKLVTIDFWRLSDNRSTIEIIFSKLHPWKYRFLRFFIVLCVALSILMTNVVDLGLSSFFESFCVKLIVGSIVLLVAIYQFFKIKSDGFYSRLLTFKHLSLARKVLVIDDFDRMSNKQQEESYKIFS